MKNRILITAALLITFALPAFALIEIEGFYWLMLPDGHASVGYNNFEGTSLDLEDDLGFDSAERIPGFKAIIGDVHQLGIGYFSLDMEAEKRVDEEVRFGPAVFPIATDITTTWEGDMLQGFYRMNLGSSFARMGFILGAQYIDFSTELKSDAGRASESIKALMPYVGGYFVGHPLPFLGVRGSAIGSTWDWGDIEAGMLDIELAAEANFVPGIYVAAGYRHSSINVMFDDDNIDIDVTFSGPIVYMGFEW